MANNKKGLNTKVIIVTNPQNGDEFEIFITYQLLNNNPLYDDDDFYDVQNNVDIKSYESNNDEDMPTWVTEDLVYDSFYDDVENELENEDESYEGPYSDEDDEDEDEDSW